MNWRNKPCGCGSGKKAKKCCDEPERFIPEPNMTLDPSQSLDKFMAAAGAP